MQLMSYTGCQVMATRRLPPRAMLHVSPDDAKFAMSNFVSGGTLSGRFKNLAVYSRSLRVMEAQVRSWVNLYGKMERKRTKFDSTTLQTMTTRLRPTPIGVEEEVMQAKKKAEGEEEEEEERLSSVEQYVRLVCTSLPEGYWPMVKSRAP